MRTSKIGESHALGDLKSERAEALNAANAILARVEKDGKRNLTAQETALFDEHMAAAGKLNERIASIENGPNNTLSALMRAHGPQVLLTGVPEASGRVTNPNEHPTATAFRNQFASWMNNALQMVEGGRPAMGATAPSGPVSVGTTSGWDSIGITVVPEVLPYLPSYYNLDSFGLAGATQIFTDHTRPLVKPILSAGAADSTFTENQAPSTSQPFGLSSFTFGGTKYARLVLASDESLMNSELPLQGAILDELLASLATTLTAAVTTSFVAALTGASSSLAVGVGGSGGSIYTSMIDLRHAVPPRFDLPSNKWMLSRATLAEIRNTRASTSGVPMFSPDGTKLFDRDYVLNDNLDSVSGAGVGFVAFGSFADGVWIRRTPIQTRVFYELYASSGQLGFRTTQWNDAHFLAELAGAAQPPTFQPIYYTNVVSES
jgi:HK97 family phage major capsid protein